MRIYFKKVVKSGLRNNCAHNKEKLPDLNIAQLIPPFYFLKIETVIYIHFRE